MIWKLTRTKPPQKTLKTIKWNWYHVELVVIAEGDGKVVGVGIVRVVGHLTFVEGLGLIVGRTFDRSTVRWSSMFWNFDFSGKFRPEKQKETLESFFALHIYNGKVNSKFKDWDVYTLFLTFRAYVFDDLTIRLQYIACNAHSQQSHPH